MLRVMVNVKLLGEDKGRDLEVPAEVPVRELAQLVADALDWSSSYSYEVMMEHSGEKIPSTRSLAEVEAWSGTTLVFSPSQRKSKKTLPSSFDAWFESERSEEIYPLLGKEMWLGRKGRGAKPRENLIDLGGEPLGNTVSRNHARVVMKEGRWMLIVEKALNATALNGTELKAGRFHPLSDGDVLQMGGVTLHFHQIPDRS